VLKTNAPSTIVVPVTASQVIEAMAEKYRGNVIRQKHQTVLYAAYFGGQIIGTQKGYQQFSLQFDAINALVSILEFLAKEKRRYPINWLSA
jgi:phosphomannomutase